MNFFKKTITPFLTGKPDILRTFHVFFRYHLMPAILTFVPTAVKKTPAKRDFVQ
jgi:hypothetical protein